MSKEPWLVSHLTCFLEVTNICFCLAHVVTCQAYFVFRWYWLQYWGCSGCNHTRKVSTCESLKDPKIKFISGNLWCFYLFIITTWQRVLTSMTVSPFFGVTTQFKCLPILSDFRVGWPKVIFLFDKLCSMIFSLGIFMH